MFDIPPTSSDGKRLCSNFSMITAMFSVVRIFRISTMAQKSIENGKMCGCSSRRIVTFMARFKSDRLISRNLSDKIM